MRNAFFVFVMSVFASLAAYAQQMPNAAQMAGMPLGAPELADGTVSVRVMREQLGNNVAGHPVTLKGAQLTKTGTTDAQGRATFTGIEAGTVVVAVTTVDGEELQSQEFDIPAKGGVRVALISGLKKAAAREAAAADAGAKEPPRPGVVVFGGESRVIMEFQDDSLQVFYILDVVNNARTPIDTGGPLVIDLPQQAVGAATMEGSSPLASVTGRRVTINGPFPPGTTPIQVGYTVPHETGTLTLEQPWPAPFDQIFVAVEKVGDVKIASPQLPEQQEAQASGTKFLMGRGPHLDANQPFSITLSGLPHHSKTIPYAGVALALVILGMGFWAAFTGAPARKTETAKLQARREKLYGELVGLEQQRRSGRIDDNRYASKRHTLMTELERVLGELDRSPSTGGEGVAA